MWQLKVSLVEAQEVLLAQMEKLSILFHSKEIITSRKNYLSSIWTSKISQGYCTEQPRAGKMEDRRDNLIGLFYLIFMILMKNDLNK